MSSLKMTFSLASLVLILGLVFVATPAMAVVIPVDQADSADVADSTRTIDRTLVFTNGTTGVIPAGGYLIIHRGAIDGQDNITGLPSFGANVNTYLWGGADDDAMPDLEALFGEEGGTILLKASLTNVDPDGTVISSGDNGVGLRPPQLDFGEYRYDHDGDDDAVAAGLAAHAEAVANDGKKDDKAPADAGDASPARDPHVDDLTITEIMWALNTANVGSGMEHNHQWIEIWNRENVPFPLKGIVLHLASGRAALSDGPTDVVDEGTADTFDADTDHPARTVLDRVSNVVGAGWVSDVGSNGFDDGADGAAEEPFVSMYRKRGNDQIKKGTGSAKGHWVASTQTSFANHKGTPGKAERAGTKIFTTTTIPRSPVIFNEIANLSAADNEWIELRNVSDAEANLKNWQISIVTSKTSDKEFFNFFDKDIKMAAGSVLLLVVSDPSGNADHPLAAGFNIEVAADQQVDGVNANSARYLIMKKGEAGNDKRGLQPAYAADATDPQGLPNSGAFVLILRKGLDKEGKAEKLIDIAGWHSDLGRDEAGIFTGLWPLVNYTKPSAAGTLNKLEEDKVHRRQKAGIDGTRTSDKSDNADHGAFRDVGWTGIGYKRNATAGNPNGGTPGYDNGSLKSDGDAVKNGASVIISEVMYTSGDRSLVQWIELYNTSKSIGVNIDNWSIFIVNHDDMDAEGTKYGGKLSERIDLDGRIPPGQTFLIAARTGRNDTNLPKGRIENAGKKRTEMLLSPYGFQLTLKAKTNEGDANKHETVDMVGNLGPAPANSRRADDQSFEPIAWELPAGINDQGDRISIVRVSDADGAITGTEQDAWVGFDMSGQIDQIIDPTSYGHSTDISSPGHTAGGILPVSLSKFRPERMKDTGAVVVRWITESETNNAGFNILRSDTRDGEFTKLNTKLIAGQGTTSARTVYEYADTSAKPNVIYYYQIQDVSLDGQVTPLAITHLRGNVTAAGKLTTTWAELKALQ